MTPDFPVHLCKVRKIIATFAKNKTEMTAERDMAGFALPFSAGIFLTAGMGLINMTYFHAASSVSFAVTSVLLLILMHPVHRRFGGTWTWVIIAVLGMSAGAFIGSASGLMEISSDGSGLVSWASGFGHRLGAFIDAVPFGDGQTNALLKALITGERTGIAQSVTDAFRESGASHILSLSGFHLGIIYGIVTWALSGLGNGLRTTRIRSFSVIAVCGLYTLATGAGPSIVRAFLFILLGEAARLTHRHRSTGSILLSAMLIQLVLDPGSVRSVSFQLSYAAMAGIAWIYPWFRDLWPGRPQEDRIITKGMRWIWNSASMSIACQLTTGPLAYFYFESFPLYFLLTNLIALPLTSILIPVGLVALVLSGFGICPQLLLDGTDLLARTLTASLEVIAGM